MNRTCINKYEEDLWNKCLISELKKLSKLEESVNNDPTSNMIKIHVEFNEMLKSGEDRTSKEFADKTRELAKKEKFEKNRSKRFDLLKEMDKLTSQTILVGDIRSRIARLSFENRRHLK